MKDIKVKYFLMVLSYLFLIFLIIISYVSIIPEDEVPILENTKSLIKEQKDILKNNENSVYEILEKAKSIEEIIEKEIENKEQINSIKIKTSTKNLEFKFTFQRKKV